MMHHSMPYNPFHDMNKPYFSPLYILSVPPTSSFSSTYLYLPQPLTLPLLISSLSYSSTYFFIFLDLSLLPSLPLLVSPSSASTGEAVTDMVTAASDLFHVVNGAFTMKKMCEQSMNQSLHDGSVEGGQCRCMIFIPYDCSFPRTVFAVPP